MSASDLVARGLAARTAVALDRARIGERLLAGIARAAAMPFPPPLSAVRPTIAAGYSFNDDGGLAGGRTVVARTVGAFTLLRGRWAVNGNGEMVSRAVTSQIGGATSVGFPLIRFWSDAPDLAISFRGGHAGAYLLRVDGGYVHTGALGVGSGDGGEAYQRITWGDGSAAQRAPRLYEIEANGDFYFNGVAVGPTASLWPAPLANGLKVLVHGDSFVEGTGAGFSAGDPFANGIGPLIALRLGQPDTVVSGLGGTGFCNPGVGRIAFPQRVRPDVIAPAPDVIVELGGINDGTFNGWTRDDLAAAVNGWIDQVVAALPDVLIFMTGPMSPGSRINGNPDFTAIRDIKKAAVARHPGNALFIDNVAQDWVFGTGHQGAEAGDGNADWVTGPDGTHPSSAGHDYLANRVVAGMVEALPT